MYAYDLQEGDAKAIKIIRRGRVRDMSRLDVEIKVCVLLCTGKLVCVDGGLFRRWECCSTRML